MDNITIPPAALEASARELTMALVLAVDEDCRACALTDDERMEVARAACLAMLKAWPGSYSLAENDSAVIRDVAAIILPLPQEASDE